MNGYIPNQIQQQQNNNPAIQPVAQVAPLPVAAAAGGGAVPAAAIAAGVIGQAGQSPAHHHMLINGAIPNHHQAHHLVHYVQQQPQAPHQQPQLIPNGNVIQLAGHHQPAMAASPQIQLQHPQAIYIRGPGPGGPGPPAPAALLIQQPQPVRMMMNGVIPGAVSLQPTRPGGATIRMIRLTPNGTYGTTATGQMVHGALTPTATATTTLVLTKAPPPKCLLCCLACCGLESLWFNPNFHFSRVIALICNILVDLLMILCLLSTNWLTTIKYRQGLWQYCIDVDSPRPLPFGLDDHDGCHWGRNAAYIKLSGFFAVACFSLAIIATILTSLGLSSRDPNKKYTFYRFALYINLGALLAIIVSLTLYPAFFYSELHHTNMVPANRPQWYFGWAYGVGWGAAIFLVGAILLLVCDKETEEIYYQERTIVHAATNNSQHQLQQHPLTNNHHQAIKA